MMSMKPVNKGILLGVSLVIVNKFCCMAEPSFDYIFVTASLTAYFLVTAAFLASEKLSELLVCGFVGLAVMFGLEIIHLSGGMYIADPLDILIVYIYGFFGSMAALAATLFLVLRKSNVLNGEIIMNEVSMKHKIMLLAYALFSAVSFSYLIMPEKAGISVPIFTILQFVFVWFLVPDKKRLVFFIPLFILSLNSFISASDVWDTSNFIVSTILYACMFTDFDFKSDSFDYVADVIISLIKPLKKCLISFKWTNELLDGKAAIIKRVMLALCITVPAAIVLIVVLSNADMVFSAKTEGVLTGILEFVNLHTVFIGLCGIAAGLYLFGIMNRENTAQVCEKTKKPSRVGDLIIINIFLSVLLVVYTMFVSIQFKYLFAGSALPDGLNYTEYARKGFFELLALTGVNIAVILVVIRLVKGYESRKSIFTKILCHYLCAVTVVLLISSFYRMFLYTNDDGLTRLRLYVMGFLFFEAVGLLITFIYIAKPKFNISLIYCVVALLYYLILNVVPTDRIIAQNQVDKYLRGEREGLEYIFTLSEDAAPVIEYLMENTDDAELIDEATRYTDNCLNTKIPERWQRYNLSTKRMK